MTPCPLRPIFCAQASDAYVNFTLERAAATSGHGSRNFFIYKRADAASKTTAKQEAGEAYLIEGVLDQLYHFAKVSSRGGVSAILESHHRVEHKVQPGRHDMNDVHVRVVVPIQGSEAHAQCHRGTVAGDTCLSFCSCSLLHTSSQ